MSQNSESSREPRRSGARLRVVLVSLLVIAAIVLIVRGRKVDDAALASALERTWIAVDPNDATLHRREVPVAKEQLVIRADQTLTHVIELASKPGHPDRDPWAWKVRKGRLYVRFLGEDASGQWLPGFAFSVSDTTLSIRVQDHPPKEWVRG